MNRKEAIEGVTEESRDERRLLTEAMNKRCSNCKMFDGGECPNQLMVIETCAQEELTRLRATRGMSMGAGAKPPSRPRRKLKPQATKGEEDEFLERVKAKVKEKFDYKPSESVPKPKPDSREADHVSILVESIEMIQEGDPGISGSFVVGRPPLPLPMVVKGAFIATGEDARRISEWLSSGAIPCQWLVKPEETPDG